FNPGNHEDDVSRFAKQRAQQNDSSSILSAWARAARLQSSLWILFPIAIAGGFAWVVQGSVHLDRLALLAGGALALFGGVNLVRGAVSEVQGRGQFVPVLLGSLAARVGIGCIALALIGGIVVTRWAGSQGTALATLGIILALLYACLPGLAGAV